MSRSGEPNRPFGPLAGLRVVELAGMGTVPHAGALLAAYGADVILVDRPGPRFGADAEHLLLRGRRRISADLKSSADLDQVLTLISHADVLIEGMRPGVAERLGVGPDPCLARNPGLIYGRVTGWGQHGPRSGEVGHDINYIALTGALHAIGAADGAPTPPLNLLGDYAGGSMLLLIGVLAALWERERSGRGQVIDAAMVDGVSVLMQLAWSLRAVGGWVDQRGHNLLDGGAPFYTTYRCADGRYMAVGALEPAFYADLLHGLGLDPETVPDRGDRDAWPALHAVLAERFAQRTRDEWADTFAGTRACATPVLSLAQAAADPHLSARGTLVEVGGATQAASAPRFSRTPAAPISPPTVDAQAQDVIAQWRARSLDD